MSSQPPASNLLRVAARANFFTDTSPSALVAGFVAMMTGYTSSLVLMFQAGRAAHLSDAQISSWIWALSIGMAVTTIGLSLRYRAPIVVAWSTPGAALLVASLPGVAYSDAIGAFVVCALLLAAVGASGLFDTLMRRIPSGIAAALLAGILFEIGIEIFRAAQFQTALVLAMFFTYLIVKRAAPRYAIVATLAAGVAAAGALGLLDFGRFHVALARPVFTAPSFSIPAIVSIGIPLFVVAMASQNVPGIAVLRADGYATPSSPLIATTGIASVVLAPFGSHGINLAAITAAICTGPEAHDDRAKRYGGRLVRHVLSRRGCVRRDDRRALRRVAEGARRIGGRARAVRLDHERPHQRDAGRAPTRSRARHVHGDRLRPHAAVDRLGILGARGGRAHASDPQRAPHRLTPVAARAAGSGTVRARSACFAWAAAPRTR